jgi:putative endopeptidase
MNFKPTVWIGIGLSIGMLGSACTQNKSVSEQAEPNPLVQNRDTTVPPNQNFYLYANGGWFKSNPVPESEQSNGIFLMVRDSVNKCVRLICERSAAFKNPSPGSNEQKIGDFFASGMDTVSINQAGLNPLKPLLNEIGSSTNKEQLWALLPKLHQKGIGAFFGFYVGRDDKNSSKNVVGLYQGGLGLPDRDYYVKNDPLNEKIRNAYKAHLREMARLMGLTEDGIKQFEQQVYGIEESLAKAARRMEDLRDPYKNYNKMVLSKVQALSPAGSWQQFSASIGIANLDSIIVGQPEFFSAFARTWKSSSLPALQAYLSWNVVNNYAEFLSKEFEDQNFAFYETVLSGTTQQKPRWKKVVEQTNSSLGELVGQVYVKEYLPANTKEKFLEIGRSIMEVYKQHIQQLDWMSAETKTKALSKLSKVRMKLGYPDKWKDYSALTISKDDLYGNVKRSTAFEYARSLKKLGTKVDRSEWGMTPQTVNAYYNPTFNEIVFPAAILQPPFFDMNAEDAVNYGGIGAVIGHEIGHGFDDQGSAFDGDGAMKNWWNEKDLAAFKTRTAKLVSQYNGYKVFPDLNVNGSFTLGENIGDLGGLSIAVKAYKASLKGKEAPVLDGFTGLQRVFIGWAQVWLNKAREEDLRNLVASNPHSPAMFRANGTIRNVPEWYEAFGVKAGDSLYLAPTERVKIW